jgi:hypothetical protein
MPDGHHALGGVEAGMGIAGGLLPIELSAGLVALLIHPPTATTQLPSRTRRSSTDPSS